MKVPCMKLQICSSLKNNKIIKEGNINQNAHYICSKCFQTEGGHFCEWKGSGTKAFSYHEKHTHNNTNALKLLR